MLKNYIVVAWRNITKSRSYAAVNITGLAVGIAFMLLIGSYVWNEFEVNHNLRNIENQYIIQSRWGDATTFDLTTVGELARSLKDLYPNLIENYYRWDGISSNVSKGDKVFREDIQIGDSTLLSMYGFPLLDGNTKTALNDPYSAVITEETAIKYFGRTNVTGETLSIGSFSGTKHDFLITGVLKKIPRNSIISINDDNRNTIFLSAACIGFFGRIIDSWNNPWIVGYVQLKKGVRPDAIEQIMRKLVKQNTPLGISDQMKPLLVPLKDYYLEANNGLVGKMLSTLTLIALFILFMAIVNFINISVSQASARMKEIGVRKVLGGMRKQLIFQFLTESFLLVVLSTLFALGLYEIFRPALMNTLDAQIPSLIGFPLYIYGILIALVLLISLLSGFYPALVLSGLKPVDVIKGKLTSVKENIILRKFLVSFQFSIAAIVLIGAILISRQVNFFLNGDLGYDKSYILSAQVPRDWTGKGVQHMETVRNEFVKIPAVENASLSYEIPDGNIGDVPNAFRPGQDSTKAISVLMLKTDASYLTTFKIPLKAGRFFSQPDMIGDSTNIVLNETAVNVLGWKDARSAIGGQLKLQGYNGTVFTIIGVTRDFMFGTMQGTISSLIFCHVNYLKQYRFLSFRVRPGNLSKAIETLQKNWSVLLPGSAFEYLFMDDRLKNLYKTEIQLKQASYTATALAAIIVLLGVFGLVSLSIEKRRREISIRKVLGSSVAGIMALFIKEFLLIILLACAISCPIAYVIIHKWLNGYAYRINITILPFLFSILILGTITALLIIFRSVRAANANPVISLRSE
jgi:putative ABC transport system permease protein